MLSYFWVMLGGALGTGARFCASGFIGERYGDLFPLGTLFVNISGSFLLGFVAGLGEPGASWLGGPWLINLRARQFLMTGICGGYTTFSSFSLQTFNLAHTGDWFRAALYTGLSLVGCVLAVWFGRSLALLIWSR
jgi:CrcB protein